MGGFPQPLQKFAAAGENYDFVSAVNLYPKKETLFVSTQILNLSANKKKFNVKTPFFGFFFTN